MNEQDKTTETPAPAGSNEESAPATVPSYRLREETDRRSKAENDAKSAREALATLTTEFETLQRANESLSTKHHQDLSLYGAGVTDNEVREFVRSRFDKRENSETGFDDWLKTERETPSPILAPFLRQNSAKPPAPPAAAETDSKTAPNPNAGTSQPNNHQSKAWGADELATIRKQNNGRLGANRDSILATLRAEGLIK